MQKFWKVVLEGRGCTREEAVAMRLRLRNARKSLEWVGEQMALQGLTNGGGRPYHRYQLSEMIEDGLTTSLSIVADRPIEVVRPAVRELLRRKVRYQRSTPKDPSLCCRLNWQRYRKTGRKPNNSWYDRKTK
jgi:hypothetical protein